MHLVKFDRERFDGEIAVIRDAGVFDYVRMIAAGLIGGSWADREVDARWPDWAEVLGTTIDELHARAGVRTHLTLFGGTDGGDTDTPDKRRSVVRAAAEVVNARPSKVFVVEIGNECYDNGPDNEEVRELAALLRSLVKVPVTFSAPANDETDLCDLYGHGGADVCTLHVERDVVGDGGTWEPCWKPFEYPWGSCAPPKAALSSEPAGPWSSVYAEFDPVRLVMAAATCWVAGFAGYVLHCGPGIRSGGAWDRNRGIPASLAETPHWDAIIGGLRVVKTLLPGDVANWQRHNGHWDSNPLNFVVGGRSADGGNPPFDRGDLFKAVAMVKDGAMEQPVLALRRPLKLQARHAMTLDVMDPLTGEVRSTHTLSEGEMFTLAPRDERVAEGDGVILRGRHG